MIVVTSYETRKRKSDGKEFIVLIIESTEPEVIVSAKTGKAYFNLLKMSVPSSMSEVAAKRMIGKELPGVIEKVPCDAYEYTTSEGATITLNHTYNYNPAKVTVEEEVLG